EAEREGVLLPLRGLGEVEIGEFIEGASEISPTRSLISLLSETTDGNPFFLSEILRLMAAEGRLAGDSLIAPRQLGIPSGVRESIKRRTAPLSDDTRDVLAIASVIGREFDINSLERASQIPREAIIELLDKAVALELITEVEGVPGRYSFRHGLIREALYDALPTMRRRMLHRLVADAIRSIDAPELHCAEIAYHYSEAAPIGEADLCVEYSRRAAQIAEKQLAYEEAARHLRTALE